MRIFGIDKANIWTLSTRRTSRAINFAFESDLLWHWKYVLSCLQKKFFIIESVDRFYGVDSICHFYWNFIRNVYVFALRIGVHVLNMFTNVFEIGGPNVVLVLLLTLVLVPKPNVVLLGARESLGMTNI